MATNLYRHFDRDGRLLYVGMSVNALARLMGHKASSEWFPKIATVSIEHFSRRRDAERAERSAIRSEKPKYNVLRYRKKRRARKPSNQHPTHQNRSDEWRPQFGPAGDLAVVAGFYARQVTQADIETHRARWGTCQR